MPLIHTFHEVLTEAGALSGTRGPLLPVGTPSYYNSSHTRLGGYHGSCETGGGFDPGSSYLDLS